MNKGSRIVLTVLLVAILVSAAYTYWHIMVQQNFLILNDIEEEDADTMESEELPLETNEAPGEEETTKTP